MKQLTLKSLRFIPTTLGLACCLLACSAKAQSQYFTNNIVNNAAYSWDAAIWNAANSGANTAPYTFNWTAGQFARFYNDAGDTNIVTVNATESMAGMYLNSGTAALLIINDAGNNTGSLSIVPNSTPQVGTAWFTQGFLTGGGILTINCPIVGTGGISESSGGGHLQLYGTNTYSGGTLFTSSATFVDFNSTNSFGTGPIGFNGTTFSLFESTASTPVTIANNITNLANGGVDFLPSVAGGSIIMSGPWALLGTSQNIRIASVNSTTTLTLSGVISSSGTPGTLNYSANGPVAPIYVTGANTYTGPTTIGGTGNAGPIVSVGSLNYVNSGTWSPHSASNLGAPTTVANGTIGIGATTVAGTLVYTGAGETSDRVINLLGTTGGATIEMDGAGPLVLTTNFTATGAGSKTLTLQGISGAANTIGMAIVDNSSANKTSLVKAQTGTWVLAGNNTYSGGTTVSNGTLIIGSGSISNSLAVTVTGGTLQLDSATTLNTNTIITITNTSTPAVNLNFAGTQVINGLYIGGVAQAVGTYGSTSSSAGNKLPVFSSSFTGVLSVAGPPKIATQPQSVAVWSGSPAAFTVAATGSPTYQWKLDGTNIPGANLSSYSIAAATVADAGTYACYVTNTYGWTNTANAYLTVRSQTAYTTNILTEPGLISYYRLDELGGSTAYDCFGANNGTYNNAVLGVTPGSSLLDPNDACVILATNGVINNKAYVSIPNGASAFNFFSSGTSATFTLECWAYFTNLTFTPQRMFSSVNSGFADGYGFGISSANQLEFSCFGYEDYNAPLATPLQLNTWYHLAVTSQGTALNFYLNGNLVWATNYFNTPIAGTTGGTMNLGNDLDGTYGFVSEQFMGRLDEVAIYNVAVPQADLLNHYQATLPEQTTAQTPQADYPTNYVTRTTTLFVNASGQSLEYQWYCNGSPVSGANSSALVLSPLDLSSNAATFTVAITNSSFPANYTNPPGVTIAVLPIPTNASQLNLTGDLVLHLPLTNNPVDISGHNNNGTNVGANLAYVADSQALGGAALQFSSGGGNGYNFVTVGNPSDLYFGAGTDFTISFWIKQAYGNIQTNLPYIGNAAGGIGYTGVVFAPALATGGSPNGAPEWSIMDTNGHNIAVTGNNGSIDDGAWHNVVGVFTRSSIGQMYVDGNSVAQQAIFNVGDLGMMTNAWNIGQDPTGVYGGDTAVATSGLISDVGVWRQALSSVQIAGIYLAGSQNTPAVSFASVVVSPTTISNIIGSTLSYGGGSGSQFVLLGTNDVTAPLTNWTRIHTNPSTPGSFTIIPAVGSAPAMFYRVQSE